ALEVVRHRQRAREGAVLPLDAVVAGVLLLLFELPFGADGQLVALEGHVDVLLVEAGQLDVDRDRLLGLGAVDRGDVGAGEGRRQSAGERGVEPAVFVEEALDPGCEALGGEGVLATPRQDLHLDSSFGAYVQRRAARIERGPRAPVFRAGRRTVLPTSRRTERAERHRERAWRLPCSAARAPGVQCRRRRAVTA